MSLIYEALERLEREKKGKFQILGGRAATVETASPALTTSTKEKTSSDRNAWAIYTLGGILLLLFAAGVFWLLMNSSARVQSPVQEPSQDAAASPSPPNPAASLWAPIYKSQFSLTGITSIKNERTAIVNNQFVRAGEWVNGAKVKAVEEEEVLLDYGGQTVILSLHQ